MPNYYEILGVKQTASFAEIKAAFRKLAMIYHPDKNPAGQENFKLILKAYETLSNPSKKSYYDIKLKYNNQHHHHSFNSSSQKTSTKNWSFDEKEMKRRQYYNEHIKKYAKNGDVKTAHAELKKGYNEYKYILFATPLAVALFLVIVNFATPSKKQNEAVIEEKATTTLTEPAAKHSLKMGDTPYPGYFGKHFYDTLDNQKLTIKNSTGMDMIVCLFTKDKFLRSCFIKSGYFIEVSQLPKKKLNIRYITGTDWDFEYELKEAKLYGAFTKSMNFFKSVKSPELSAFNELTFVSGENEGFKEIKEKEFFSKEAI